MNCEIFQSEMHTWRNQSNTEGFQPLFKHLATCPNCNDIFRRMTSKDEAVRQTILNFPQPLFLEKRILAGLRHERSQIHSLRRRWTSWMLVPLLAVLLAVAVVGSLSIFQRYRLHDEIAVLLSRPPEPQVVSIDRQKLLVWSSQVLKGSAELPPELNRVQFRGATALTFRHRQAVLLKMKNEHRASLLVVNGELTKHPGFDVIAENNGTASLWSDGHRTYVLLFNGSREEMQGYMEKMGITA